MIRELLHSLRSSVGVVRGQCRLATRFAWPCAALGLMLSSCAKDPTEVVVQVYSDVPCDGVAAVAAGPAGELGDRPASAISTVCDPMTGSRGDLVLVPKTSDTGELAVEVRIRTDQAQPDDCLESNHYDGCIVSRRILNYIPGRTVHMRIDLRNPCLDIPCSQTTSCVAQGLSKACVTAHIDPTQCSGVCTDSDLVTQSGSLLDVCGAGSNPCPNQTDCQASEAGASCVCQAGYENPAGDPVHCLDINECSAKPGPCDVHAECTNTPGSFDCACKTAYQGDGKTCAQTACDAPCGNNATCVPAGSAFMCSCDSGYTGDGTTCTDVDECAAKTANCAAVATCTNTPGSFSCQCPDGYTGDGTTCTDVDECAAKTSNCAAVATCTNTPGSFSCQCPDGYTGDGTTCTDVDECAAKTANCAAVATCTNTPGSFSCECPDGYTGDGTTCMDVDECAAKTANCAAVATCTNTPGSFSCQCPDGYTGDGTTCTDVDECALQTFSCGAHAGCVNTPGAYACQCMPGFTGDPSACICDGTVNASLGASASASSTYGGYDVVHINDGNNTTIQTGAQSWVNNWPVAFPQWVELDFPSERVVGRVEMYTSDGYVVSAYDIAVWDGVSWNVVASKTDNVDVHNTLIFSPVSTTKLRLVASTGASNQAGYARVNELETYCQ